MKKRPWLHASTAALCFILSGCASNRVWYNPDKTAQEAEQDLRYCRYEAEKATANASAAPVYDPIGSGFSIGMTQARLLQQCMELKGYRLVSPKELPAGSTVDRLR